MSNLEDDRIIDKATDNGLDPLPEEEIKDEPAPKHEGFRPKGKVAVAAAEQAKAKPVESLDSDEVVTAARLKSLEETLKKLVKGSGGVKIAPKPEQLDYSKLKEHDVFDLSVPIEAIEHDIPDYMDVKLKDTNYVPRWVHKSSRRLGTMRATGWLYVTAEDLGENLKLEIQPNENGHYVLDDVVLMRCSKQKYYGQLRRNFIRAKMMVDPKSAHQIAKKRVEKDLREAGKASDYDKYTSEGKLEVYAPGFEL